MSPPPPVRRDTARCIPMAVARTAHSHQSPAESVSPSEVLHTAAAVPHPYRLAGDEVVDARHGGYHYAIGADCVDWNRRVGPHAVHKRMVSDVVDREVDNWYMGLIAVAVALARVRRAGLAVAVAGQMAAADSTEPGAHLRELGMTKSRKEQLLLACYIAKSIQAVDKR